MNGDYQTHQPDYKSLQKESIVKTTRRETLASLFSRWVMKSSLGFLSIALSGTACL
jgi:hypothetical protein